MRRILQLLPLLLLPAALAIEPQYALSLRWTATGDHQDPGLSQEIDLIAESAPPAATLPTAYHGPKLAPYAEYLPDPRLTPGAVDPSATVERLRSPEYIKQARNVTTATKKKIYAEYGVRNHPTGTYEVDHLISIELGGSNDPSNLWPQPYHALWNAHQKDRLENWLHRQVEAGKLSLADAQDLIRRDWIQTYAWAFPEDILPNGTPKPVGQQPNAEPDTQ